MTVTRSQAGKTPKKVERPDFVETPTRRVTRSRASATPDPSSTGTEEMATSTETQTEVNGSAWKRKTGQSQANGHTNGHANGHANGSAKKPRIIDGWAEGMDPKVDYSGQFEFGGDLGALALMTGFPLLMYYMWIGATYYDGKLPLPEKGQSFSEFLAHLGHLVYTGAYPSLKAWTIFWVFFIFEAACYILLPGVQIMGRPLPHEGGKQLLYHCSAVWSFYVTLATVTALHATGLFKLYTIIDEFGPLMSVAVISGFAISVIAYVSAIYRGRQHRMTGHLIYDFFMGAELNPRMFGILDFKMFFEVRLPWYILLLITMGAAARQYENYGYVSGEMGLLLLAHWLYANACSKGEECIVSTWDMYYEKWGFMLIFWNIAGVPLSYCHCTIYLANRHPDTYRWNRAALVAMYALYLFVYWVWDTANAQKNRFRQQERGTMVFRKTFPQLPWSTLKNPEVIRTPEGHTILVSGWYGLARKVHYTCDAYFALQWALVTGFESPFPWFYPVFFAVMIAHRAMRDIHRCRVKYGEAWKEYERRVPYLFIPYVF